MIQYGIQDYCLDFSLSVRSTSDWINNLDISYTSAEQYTGIFNKPRYKIIKPFHLPKSPISLCCNDDCLGDETKQLSY